MVHRKMVLHGAMPLHLIGFLCLSLGPLEPYSNARRLLTSLSTMTSQSHLARLLAVFSAMCLVFSRILYFGTLSHAFLLSDNR